MSEHQRIPRSGRTVAIGMAAALALGGGGYAALTASAQADDDVAAATVVCPRLADLPADVPGRAQAEVNRDLAQLDARVLEASRRLAGSGGRGGGSVQNTVLGPLRDKRIAVIDRIGLALDRAGVRRPQGIDGLASCSLKSGGGQQDPRGPGSGAASSPSAAPGGLGGGAPGAGAPGGSGQAADGSGFANGLTAADFVDIRTVRPGAKAPDARTGPSRGTFTSSCGVSDHNNPDNFIVAPGVSNGAHHVHDYVGNKTTDGFSTDDSLAAAGTSCSGGDKSAYYWPVLRLTKAGDQGDAGEPGGAADQNIGTKLKPRSVQLQFSGNARSKVTPMPQFLRIITGDAKAVTNGPVNARAQWTCTGFEARRLTDRYPLCGSSQTVRILDFPSCWDGQNTDSANHRTHVVFPAADGSCQRGFKAIPQLRMTLAYRVPSGSRFAVDSFPAELHKAVTDHGDFENVMPASLMRKAVTCINTGRRC